MTVNINNSKFVVEFLKTPIESAKKAMLHMLSLDLRLMFELAQGIGEEGGLEDGVEVVVEAVESVPEEEYRIGSEDAEEDDEEVA